LWSVLWLVGVVGVAWTSGEHVRLVSDSPVMLDAPIVFTGSLESGDEDAVYRWTWMDNASPNHYNVEELSGAVKKQNYTVTFPSNQYGAWEYEMSLTIYKFVVFWWREVGRQIVVFNVTAVPNGRLEVTQNGHQSETLKWHSIVSSVKNTKVSVEFWDPSHFLATARKIVYFWFVDSVPFGQTTEASFLYNFSTPGEHEVEVTVVAYFNTTANKSSTTSTSNPLPIRKTKEDDGARSVVFLKKIVSMAPITNLNVTGDKLLKHGQLVDLTIGCDGSGPFVYCWQLKETGYNITGNETCDQPFFQDKCEYSILWYFKQSDTYNLLTIVSNHVSTHMEVIPVTVYEVAHELPLFIVIIPVVAAIVVVILIITGIAVYANLRRNLRIEVADFDFNNSEEDELQYKTFWDRLLESFSNAFLGSHSETQSEGGSSISGRRSVQLPGAGGMGYGSIT